MFGRKKNTSNNDSSESSLELDLLASEPATPFRTNERIRKDKGISALQVGSKKANQAFVWVFRLVGISIVGLMVFMCLLAMSARHDARQAMAESQALKTNAFSVRYQDLGAKVIAAYFSGSQPVVNMLETAKWDEAKSQPIHGEVTGLTLINGYDSKTTIPQEDLDKIGDFFIQPFEEHLTYIGVLGGRQYKFSLSLLVPSAATTDSRPYLMAPPMIEPAGSVVAVGASTGAPGDSRFTKVEYNEGVAKTLLTWATAYAENDRDTLKRISGTTQNNVTYPGLGNFKLIGAPTVDWSYALVDKPELSVAQVSFKLSANDVHGTKASDKLLIPQVVNVLITDISGDGHVAAWGPAGSWPTLSNDRNIIVGEAGDTPEESETSTVTATPSDGVIPGAPTIVPTKQVTVTATQTSAVKSENKPKPKATEKKAPAKPKSSDTPKP